MKTEVESQIELAEEFCETLNSISEFDEESQYSSLNLLDDLGCLGFRLVREDAPIDNIVLYSLVELMESDGFSLSDDFVEEQKQDGMSGTLDVQIDMTRDFTGINIIKFIQDIVPKENPATESFLHIIAEEVESERKK